MNNAIEIIVAGAGGRMGKMLTGLVLDNPLYRLAGAVDLKEHLADIESLPCLVTDNVGNAFEKAPNAILIDFTAPTATIRAAETAAKMNRKVVIGTTGFSLEQKELLKELAKKTAIFWSANMSVGLNAIIGILPRLANALGESYDMEIMEIHHKRKKDSPSGTALMLAESLAQARGWNLDKTRNSCRNGIIGERPEKEIGVQALRGGDVVGIHTIYFLGSGEVVEIKHQAESRENFAQGALRAAAWLKNQNPGKLYSMQDLINSSAEQ